MPLKFFIIALLTLLIVTGIGELASKLGLAILILIALGALAFDVWQNSLNRKETN